MHNFYDTLWETHEYLNAKIHICLKQNACARDIELILLFFEVYAKDDNVAGKASF